VAFVGNCGSTSFGSSHYSFSSHLPHPLYLSFESEHMEETFDIPLRLDLNKGDGSIAEHLWLIYISRPHCHFVTTGAQITFKAHPDLELKKWGFKMVFEQDFSGPFELVIDDVRQRCYLDLDHVDESSSRRKHEIQLPYNWYVAEEDIKPKIQLRYNWHVTEEEEIENAELDNKVNQLLKMHRTDKKRPIYRRILEGIRGGASRRERELVSDVGAFPGGFF
jgi:hypothetical protein